MFTLDKDSLFCSTTTERKPIQTASPRGRRIAKLPSLARGDATFIIGGMDLQIDYEGHDFARLGIEATQLEGGATRAALATSLIEGSDDLIEVAL